MKNPEADPAPVHLPATNNPAGDPKPEQGAPGDHPAGDPQPLPPTAPVSIPTSGASAPKP